MSPSISNLYFLQTILTVALMRYDKQKETLVEYYQTLARGLESTDIIEIFSDILERVIIIPIIV